MNNWKSKFIENNIAFKFVNKDNPWESVFNINCNHPAEFKYPSKNDFHKNEDNVKETFKGTFNEINAAIEKAKETDKAEYKKACDIYYKFDNDLIDVAKYLLADYINVTEKQFNIIWNKAWDMGHSSGLGEVQAYFYELADMIDNFIKADKE